MTTWYNYLQFKISLNNMMELFFDNKYKVRQKTPSSAHFNHLIGLLTLHGLTNK